MAIFSAFLYIIGLGSLLTACISVHYDAAYAQALAVIGFAFMYAADKA